MIKDRSIRSMAFLMLIFISGIIYCTFIMEHKAYQLDPKGLVFLIDLDFKGKIANVYETSAAGAPDHVSLALSDKLKVKIPEGYKNMIYYGVLGLELFFPKSFTRNDFLELDKEDPVIKKQGGPFFRIKKNKTHKTGQYNLLDNTWNFEPIPN